MVHRPGGLEPYQLQEAATALANATSIEAIAQLIDTMPAFRSPMFHAELKEQYDRFRQQQHPFLENMRPPYGILFLELHHRIHYATVLAARESGPPASIPDHAAPYAPPFFAALCSAFSDQLPDDEGPTHFLDTGLAALRQEIAAHTNGQSSLPDYEPTRGSHWAALLVRCAVCDTPRLDVRAYRVDLVAAPELEAPLRVGRINQAVCPGCGSDVCYPCRTLAIDPPGAGDDLAELTCAWRLTPKLLVYQPTPGTRRDEEDDVILEARFEWLLEQEPWEPEAQGASRAVAYSPAELLELVDRITEVDVLPVAMGTLLEQLRREISAGTRTLSDAWEIISTEVPRNGGDWPMLDPGAAQRADDPVAHLLDCWITEAVAETQQLEPAARIALAHRTTWSLVAMGESGLAAAALARGQDLLPRVEPADIHDQCSRLLGSLEAELLEATGRPNEALALRRQLDLESVVEGDSWQARVARQQLRAHEAALLWQTGDLGSALTAFPPVVDELDQLLEEAEASADETVRVHLPELQHGLSGALANFAGLLHDLIEQGDVDDPDPLATTAELLLRRALALSLDVGGFEFAGIQSHRLAGLLAQRGRVAEAEQTMQQAVEYSAHAGDHVRVGTGLQFLAGRAYDRGDGSAALGYIVQAAREAIRLEVGLGFETDRERAMEGLDLGAMRTTAAGGDPSLAIAVVESLRAAKTAAAIATGTPFRAAVESEEVCTLVEEREDLRLRLMYSDDPQLRSRLDRIVAKLAELRRQAALRDPTYARWVDADDDDVADAEAIPRRLGQLGPAAMWLGVLEGPDGIWSYSVQNGTRVEWRARPDRSSLETIADAVLAPHADRIASLRPDDTLVVSVDGPMATISFAALPFGDGLLIEQARIVTTFGLGMLASAADRPATALDSFLLVGGPLRPDLAPLHGSAAEVRAIAALVGRSATTLVGRDATVPELEAEAPGNAVLHLSCHAVTDPAEPGWRLMLSPEPATGDSGVLSEDRILSELELRPGGLVNLAGCKTGATRESDAPILGGLVPAFLVAGARSVIASHWEIADEPARRFQEELYQRLLDGEGPVGALAATQRRCIHGELGDVMGDSEIWAAWAVYGTVS